MVQTTAVATSTGTGTGRGRKPGQIPRYTIGVLYVVAYRSLKKTPEQIAKFCKTDVNTVKYSLRNHGVDLEGDSEKKAKKAAMRIKKLEAEIARLEKQTK